MLRKSVGKIGNALKGLPMIPFCRLSFLLTSFKLFREVSECREPKGKHFFQWRELWEILH